jgi:hypothetical protein
MDEGECYPAVPNVPFVMVTLGNDGFSQFDFAAPVNAFPANYVSAMWFRVADMEPAFQPS